MMIIKWQILLAFLIIFAIQIVTSEKSENDYSLEENSEVESDDLDSNGSSIQSICALMVGKLICSNIPKSCEDECEILNSLEFNENVREIDDKSFSRYLIMGNLNLTFTSLKEIKSTAFSGMIITDNAELNLFINFNGTDDETLVVRPRAFSGVIMHLRSKFNIYIKNYKNVDFYENSLTGLKQFEESAAKFSISNNEKVNFKEKCAYNWQQYTIEGDADDQIIILEDTDMTVVDGYGQKEKHDLLSTNFLIRLEKIKEVNFETMSFSAVKQSPNSIFQILAYQIDSIELNENSFSFIEQNQSSIFELNLSSKQIKMSEGIMQNITQNKRSSFVVLFESNSNSMCVPKHTINNFTQDLESTLKIQFLSSKYNIYIDEHAFVDLKQQEKSFIEIFGSRFINAYFKGFAFDSLLQSNLSFFELLFSETDNMILESSAFSNFSQVNTSHIRIGFTSTSGIFQQSPFVFNTLKQEPESKFSYNFNQSSTFSLKFPPHLTPRMLAESLSSSNNLQLIHNLYPNLGKSSRPNRISLLEYELQHDDFCKIGDVPSDLLLQLAPKTECSCLIYYLYRKIRLIEKNEATWLPYTPQCYQETYRKYLAKEFDLEQTELNCQFETLLSNCRTGKVQEFFKLIKDFKCSAYNSSDDDYITIEILNDKNENILEPNKSIFSKLSKPALISIASVLGVLVILLFILLIVFIAFTLRRRNRSEKQRSNYISDSETDSENELTSSTAAGGSNTNTNRLDSFLGPIYKKNKNKTSSVDSKNYLIDISNGHNLVNEAEKCNLVVKVDSLGNSQARSNLVIDDQDVNNNDARVDHIVRYNQNQPTHTNMYKV